MRVHAHAAVLAQRKDVVVFESAARESTKLNKRD